MLIAPYYDPVQKKITEDVGMPNILEQQLVKILINNGKYNLSKVSIFSVGTRIFNKNNVNYNAFDVIMIPNTGLKKKYLELLQANNYKGKVITYTDHIEIPKINFTNSKTHFLLKHYEIKDIYSKAVFNTDKNNILIIEREVIIQHFVHIWMENRLKLF